MFSFSRRLPSALSILLFLTLLPLAAHGCTYFSAVFPPLPPRVDPFWTPPDFQVTSPTKNVQWANNQTYPVSWVKGLLDGVDFVDLELTRMGVDGLILIARDGASRTTRHEPLRPSQFFFFFAL
jgi:hypothetical protein